MVLEATMIVCDNSEYMRNGDYTPSRWEAQSDAVNMVFSAKTNANPESSVGLMSMSGKGPEVRCTLTTDFGKILAALHDAKMYGESQLSTGIQIAQLVLKHRQNKLQRQRIIVFVGSPIREDEAALVKLAKKLKKNNIAVDFINFGEEQENTTKLDAFIAAVDKGAEDEDMKSHLVTIPPGPHLLSDMLISSPILGGGEGGGMGGAGGSGGGGGGDFEFGVDPTLDPELAMALRMSLQEEQARQEAEDKTKRDSEQKDKEGGEGSGSGEQPKKDDEDDRSGDGKHPSAGDAMIVEEANKMDTSK